MPNQTLGELLKLAQLKPCRVAWGMEITMSPLGIVEGNKFIAATSHGSAHVEPIAEVRAELIKRLLNAAPLIDRLIGDCSRLERRPDDPPHLRDAANITPDLMAILDGKS